jgi:hypothetical protein
VNGLSVPLIRELSSPSLKDEGIAGQTKEGLSIGTIGGEASPFRTIKTVFIDGLSFGFG